jgi:hypothetical protein
MYVYLSSQVIDGSVGKMDAVKSVTSAYRQNTELNVSRVEKGNIIKMNYIQSR